jgi:hypothetical protein
MCHLVARILKLRAQTSPISRAPTRFNRPTALTALYPGAFDAQEAQRPAL